MTGPLKAFPLGLSFSESADTPYTAAYLRMHGQTILYVLFDLSESPPTRYYEVSEDAVRIWEGDEPLKRWGLEDVCRAGYVELARFMMERGAVRINHGLRGACEAGNRELIALMIEGGAMYWDWGLEGACKGGHPQIVQEMVGLGAEDWKAGLGAACEGGQREIADELIDRIILEKDQHIERIWTYGLIKACRGGKVELAKRMVEVGADRQGLDAARAAYVGGNPDVVQYINDGKSHDDGVSAFKGACEYGDMRTILPLMDKQRYSTYPRWREGAYGAYKGGQLKVAKLMFEEGAKHYNDSHVIQYYIEIFAMEIACHSGHMNIIRFLLDKAPNVVLDTGGMLGVCEGGHMDILMLLIRSGNGHLGQQLEIAAYEGYRDIVDLALTREDASPNSVLQQRYRSPIRQQKWLMLTDIMLLMIDRGGEEPSYRNFPISLHLYNMGKSSINPYKLEALHKSIEDVGVPKDICPIISGYM